MTSCLSDPGSFHDDRHTPLRTKVNSHEPITRSGWVPCPREMNNPPLCARTGNLGFNSSISMPRYPLEVGIVPFFYAIVALIASEGRTIIYT